MSVGADVILVPFMIAGIALAIGAGIRYFDERSR